MPKIEITQFNGIEGFMDDRTVSDYVNVIPNGYSVIDRQGENVVLTNGTIGLLTNWFLTKDKIIVCRKGIQMYYLTRFVTMSGVVIYVVTYLPSMYGQENTETSFAESTLIPTNLYVCDTTYIYRYQVPVRNNSEWTTIQLPYPRLYPTRPKSLGWYDNRLVFADVANNIFYMSVVDPDNAGAGGGDDFWPVWVHSSENASNLQELHSFFGILYLFMDNCIEKWIKTGNNDDPIQPVTNGVIPIGGKKGLVIMGRLFFIGTDTSGHSSIYAFSQSGELSKISTPEIDKRFNNTYSYLTFVNQRDMTCLLVYQTDPRFDNSPNDLVMGVTMEGKWFTWKNRGSIGYNVISSLDGDLAISGRGHIIQMTNDHRLYGTNQVTFPRSLRIPVDLPSGRRTTINSIALNMDTGFVFSEENHKARVYLRVSFDRGVTFGPTYWRDLGPAGHNNQEIIFRKLGSGAHLVIEIGTSDNARFQLFKITIETN